MADAFKSIGRTVLGILPGDFKSKSPAPVAAAPAKAVVMPTADDEAVKAAKRRQIAELAQRSGRASTVLSSDEKLGG